MRAEIAFSTNWNNKLDCDCYTSIRIRNDDKYVLGNVYQVSFKAKPHHEAMLIAGKHMYLHQLNEFIAHLDTGYSLEECKGILLKMYPNVNFETTQISLLLFRRLKQKTEDKIAQFCSFYERYTGIKYTISRAEIGMIKNVAVDEKLLLVYFQANEWWTKVRSVTNYCKNINEIKTRATGKKSEFPNEWSEAIQKKIPTGKLSEYWAHLRSIGMKPVYFPGTSTIKEWTL